MDPFFNQKYIQLQLGSEEKHKEKTAVAISYDLEDNAPRVIASGKGYLADKIIDKAKENHIPLYQDEKVAKALSKIELGDMIPPQLYEVVSEILVFVDKMDRLRSKIYKNE